MKVWVILERDRNYDVIGVRVLKEEPAWDADFYEDRRCLEIEDNTEENKLLMGVR